jgi:hypothetical protein
MPTIPQLPSADAIAASDLIPISQGGSIRAISVGALLAQTQPAIIVEPPSLLGRISIGPGGPDVIAVGNGLMLNSGTLNATGFNPTSLPVQASLSPEDLIIITSGGATQLVSANLVRELFTAGSNITIDTNGTISSSGTGGAGSYSLTHLAPITGLAQGDLVGVSQGGQDHTITYANLLDGLTIDMAPPASSASDSDAFWVAQTTNIMLRQTLGALWPWISGKLPLWNRTVIELSVNTILNGPQHNNAILVCSSPVVISALTTDMGSGFTCDLINVSTGSVTLSGNVIASNGSNILLLNQCCTIRCVTFSGGTMAFASMNAGNTATAPPGQVPTLTEASLTSSSLSLSWTAPASGGSVLIYTIQYRVSGTTSWLPAGQTTGAMSFAITALQAATSYDFTVTAANSLGAGPVSSTVTVTTPANYNPPTAPTAVTLTNVTVSAVTVSWTPPTTGGTGLVYGVQYRLSGQTAWTPAASNLSATSTNITNLTAATAYDIQITATNSTGSGPPSNIVTVTTGQVAGLVTNITWGLTPSGTSVNGVGAIGVNVHVNPASAGVQFGFSTSLTVPPTSWIAGAHINSDFWGAYVPTPTSAGQWYAWAEGTDSSSPTVYPTSFTVT